jgi:hypothetical protein
MAFVHPFAGIVDPVNYPADFDRAYDLYAVAPNVVAVIKEEVRIGGYIHWRHHIEFFAHEVGLFLA